LYLFEIKGEIALPDILIVGFWLWKMETSKRIFIVKNQIFSKGDVVNGAPKPPETGASGCHINWLRKYYRILNDVGFFNSSIVLFCTGFA
jgi:hypothetical protein